MRPEYPAKTERGQRFYVLDERHEEILGVSEKVSAVQGHPRIARKEWLALLLSVIILGGMSLIFSRLD